MDGCAEADGDGDDGELNFSFTVIDGGRRDGCATLRVEEGVNDFGGKMEVSDGKSGT